MIDIQSLPPSIEKKIFAISLICAAILLILVIFFTFFYHIDKEIVSTLQNLCLLFAIPPLTLIMNGLVLSVFRSRPPLQEYLPILKNDFRMMGISLHDIHDDENNVYFMSHLIDKKTSPKNYKFLFLDPASPFIKQREIEEDGIESKRLFNECSKTEDILRKFKSYNENRIQKHDIQFATYDQMPKHALIIVDDRVFVGPYLNRKAGFKTHWIEITKQDTRCEYKDEFNKIWDTAKKFS